MEVKPGYKQTEVGVIPEEWEVKRLGECATFRTGPFGSALHKSDYTDDGVPVINPMHIIAGQMVPTRTMTITEKAASNLSDFRLKTGEIVMGRRGDMGRCAVVQSHQSGWLCGTGTMIIRGGNTDANFLQRVLSSPQVIAAIEDTSVGSTMINLNQSTLAGLRIQSPPLSEQRVIAGALSDVDELLGALEQLIAKKRDLKQATMQQLLTGKTRLPGFRGKWAIRNMAKHASLKARIGWQALTTEEYLGSGTYYLVTGTDFIGGRVNWLTCHFVDEWRYAQDHNIQLRDGDVLLTKDGTIGKVGYVESLHGSATLNSGVFVIRPLEMAFVPLFLFYVLTSRVFDEFLSKITAGSTITHLYQKDFVTFEFLAPEINEQTAIAEVLSDMDAELAALEQRRNKTNALKQGMMQELLTGRIRLV
ncbi:MAG: restriction endonuclease subunit S [Nitrospirota bacterium]|jgi:type I restriction enzyme S subunit